MGHRRRAVAASTTMTVTNGLFMISFSWREPYRADRSALCRRLDVAGGGGDERQKKSVRNNIAEGRICTDCDSLRILIDSTAKIVAGSRGR